ncbi:5-dehydro-4-deoxyglucarate dehydratase [Streptomyces sp. NBC_00154]|uniref:5-dehydro-4-deoxyglucarate dehydratase n=1 Tax=Streptomyces sp. NBC_00154 TaxID=2975670 RepID=UPI00225A3BCA|nr:5-dehydro-4-deoxyglucarate dehydratase [Streptomyces sp. NBC_00154]MCX5316067.1 5-dehydro-4-deoxyglucarate dehydratase [Streptomyces sp. NBC_00154]
MPHLDGVLFFPVTPFDASGALDTAALAKHLEAGLEAGPGGVFTACGTGEFHALAPQEYAEVVGVTVEVTAGRVPVYAGAGGALPLARQFARAARDGGADGLLLLPPYLVQTPAAGLVAYVEAVAAATELPLIVYHRDNARFDPASAAATARLPQVSGFKDGIGDLGHLARMVTAVRGELGGKPFQFFNGTPTAEATVLAHRAIGVDLYSSAVFCFAPEISLAFYHAVRDGDDELVEALLSRFFHPLVALREKVPGYAVALVKAAVRQRGLDVGGVRPPLVDPTPEHLAELRRITEAGLAVCDEAGVR